MYLTRREFLLAGLAAAGFAIVGGGNKDGDGKARIVAGVDNFNYIPTLPIKVENVTYPVDVERVVIDGEEVLVLSLQKMLGDDFRLTYDRKNDGFNLGSSKAGDESIKGVVTNFGPINLSYQTLNLDGSVDRNTPTNWTVTDREERLIARRPVFYLPR